MPGMRIRDVLSRDPLTTVIPNDGVTKVIQPQSENEWAVLRYELESFVCEGEYRQGLDRILSAFLANVSHPQQQAVWVSGFYGSGKSHLVRVLEYLWRDVEFPDGARARSLVTLPSDLRANLMELSRLSKMEACGPQRALSVQELAPSDWLCWLFSSKAQSCPSNIRQPGLSYGSSRTTGMTP